MIRLYSPQPRRGGELNENHIYFHNCYDKTNFESSNYRIWELIDDIWIANEPYFVWLSKTDWWTIIDKDEFVTVAAQSNSEMFWTTYIDWECGALLLSHGNDSYHLYAIYQQPARIQAKIKWYINWTPMWVYMA